MSPPPAVSTSAVGTPAASPSAAQPIDWPTRLRWALGIGLLGGVLLYLTWSVLPVLIAAAVLGYLLDRPVTWLHARGMSRDLAFVLLLLGAVVLVVVSLVTLLPLVVHQVAELASNITPYVERLGQQLTPYKSRLEDRLGVPIPLDLEGLAAVAPEYLQRVATLPNAGQVAQDVISRVAGGGVSLVLSTLTLALVPLFTYYVCVDWRIIVSGVDGLIPPRWRPQMRGIAAEIDGRTMAFVQGQLILVCIQGVLFSIGFLIAGIDLAIIVGLLTGVLFLVPYVGPLTGLVLASALAVLKHGLDWHVLACLGTFVVVQALEGSVLTPRIVGSRVGLHPMVVMVGVVVFGNLLGVWGLMAAVPLTAALSVIGAALLDGYRKSRLYGG